MPPSASTATFNTGEQAVNKQIEAITAQDKRMILVKFLLIKVIPLNKFF
jgi:hypothetical protein